MRDNEKMTVKPGLEAQYEEYVNKNYDFYGNGVIVAAALWAKAIDDGEPFENAIRAADKMGITGFMAGCAAESIAHYHPRGDEFRRWWNKKHQIKDEGDKANDDGTILNPAILSIG